MPSAKFIILLVFAGFMACFPVFGGIDPANENATADNYFSEEVWQKEAKKYDFSEESPKVKTSSKKSPITLKGISMAVRVIFFTAFFILIIYLLVRFIRGMQNNAAAAEQIAIEVNTLSEAEENLTRANIAQLLEKLVAEKRFREATRAYFLLVLQQLNKSGLIEWKKQKTNFDYVRETAGKQLHLPFEKTTRFFEFVWYGNQPVHEDQFPEVEARFQQLLNAIAHEQK